MTETPAPATGASSGVAGPILVGVMPGQRPVVIEHALRIAAATGLQLVCAYADVTVYPVDGTIGGPAAPIDPDGVDADAPGIPETLKADITAQAAGSGVECSMVRLAGEPAHALAREAKEIGASMIVVGTREHRLSAALKDLTAGSVARHLFHRQDVPVLVVPVNPRVTDDNDDD